ncbi:MAG: substrate-binding periplasmic protein [Pontibacterium sp.]
MLRMLKKIVPVLCFVTLSLQAAERTLHVNTGFTPPVSAIYDQVLREAGEKIGIDVRLQTVSAERSLQLVTDHIDDAECCRIKAIIEKAYPDLTPVEPSFFSVRFVAFTRTDAIKIRHWDDLKPYSAGTVTGWKIHVNNLKRVQPARAHILDSVQSLFKMLDNHRIDVALLGDYNGLYELSRQGITQYHMQSPPLAEVPLHLLLNKKNADLAKPLGQALKGMQDNGRVDQIIQQVMDASG